MVLSLNPRRVLRFLLTVIGGLAIANACVVASTHVLGHGRLYGLVELFDFNQEGNLPSFFSALQLAFASFVLFAIAHVKRVEAQPHVAHWRALAVLFAFLSVDEAASLHEIWFLVLSARSPLPGAWSYGWYIPYGLLLVAFALAFRRFFWALPRVVRTRFACAGAVFLAGAVGLEMAAAYLYSLPGVSAGKEARIALLYSLEELLEMVGIALFVHAVLDHAASLGARAQLVFRRAEAESRVRAPALPWPADEPAPRPQP